MVSSTTSMARMTASWSMSIAASTACSASSEYGGRRSPYGSRPSGGGAIEYSTGKLDIFPGGALPGGIAKQSGGMIGHDQRHPIVTVHLTAQLANRELRLEKSLGRKGAQRQYHLGPDELDLPYQIRRAGDHLVGHRIAVPGWAMLEDVGDEHVFTLEVDRGEDLVEQLARLSHERLSLLVLVRSRRLAHTHEIRVGTAHTRHGIGRRRVERTAATARDHLRDLLERVELRRWVVEQRAARPTDHEARGHVD